MEFSVSTVTLKHSPSDDWQLCRHDFCFSLNVESALVMHRLKHRSCER